MNIRFLQARAKADANASCIQAALQATLREERAEAASELPERRALPLLVQLNQGVLIVMSSLVSRSECSFQLQA